MTCNPKTFQPGTNSRPNSLDLHDSVTDRRGYEYHAGVVAQLGGDDLVLVGCGLAHLARQNLADSTESAAVPAR